MQKLICVKNKTSKIISRIPMSEALVWVGSGIANFVRKGSFKRQESNAAKAARRPKKKAIFGAKIVREYNSRKAQQMTVPS